MSIVDEFIAEIEATGRFALVAGVAELAALGAAAPPASPAAYVFVDEEASELNERINGVLQRTETDVGVIIITSDVSDARGAAASNGIDALKKAVRTALVGWQPASAEDVVTHVAGRLANARGGVVTWEDTFATASYLTA